VPALARRPNESHPRAELVFPVADVVYVGTENGCELMTRLVIQDNLSVRKGIACRSIRVQ